MKHSDSDRLMRLKSDWERLGHSDPLWAVYVSAQGRHGRWDVEEFLDTGHHEIEESWSRFTDTLGSPPPVDGVVLDFGCGVGRLSTALANRFKFVIGIDISASMLNTASRVIPSDLRDRVALVQSSSADLPLRNGAVDFVYTSLVLQHMPSHLAVGYICEFLRVLKPGGHAMVQVAVRPDKSVKGYLFRLLPPWLYGSLQRVILRYPAPMRMEGLSLTMVREATESHGGELIDHWEDLSYGGHWSYRRILLRRRVG